MLSCQKCFTDYITRCETAIYVRAVLEPNASYIWKITDKFENEYEGAFTTDDDGLWAIDVDALPAGLLTQYAGKFKLKVYKAGSCSESTMLIAQEYDCIEFEVRGGTSTKDEIGCPVECVSSLGEQSELIPFTDAASVIIDWTPERLVVFGDVPTVEVHHLVYAGIYELVQVPVVRSTTEGQLQQLEIQNGGAETGYVLIS